MNILSPYFQQLTDCGFLTVSIEETEERIVMRLHPKKLSSNGIRILKELNYI